MRVVLRINAYQKKEECILGHISFLGLYEVRMEAIEKFKIRENPVVHYGDVYIITERKKDITDFGLFEQDLLFYNLATNYWSGQSLGKFHEETTCLMFDPAVLLGPLTRLNAAKDSIINSFKGTYQEFIIKDIEQGKEIEFLQNFQSLVEESMENNSMIGITLS
ncbi:MAG TPA: hypothetical protein VMR70_15290 [Flavisolibacter sp.]|nr:hypothetical protein [Flavisolibacter sp.]